VKLRLRRPRDLARQLRLLAHRRPDDVEDYLGDHVEEWAALAGAIPGDAADILESIDEEAAGSLVAELDPAEAAEVFEELRDDLAADLLLEMPTGAAALVLDHMPPDEAADILALLDADEAAPLMDLMSDQAEGEVRRLLRFAPDSAGGLMTTDIAALPIGLTAGEAIERLRVLDDHLEDLSYVYIVDEHGRLEGVLSFRDLVFKRPGVGLDQVIVRNPIAVDTSTDRAEVAEITRRYHLFGLPVVDDQGVLVGMVTTDAVLESVQAEASEDFATAVGAGPEETVYTGVLHAVRMRLPWLSLNLVLALAVAFVIEGQTGIIEREPVLAALAPVVALLGGNGGNQSLAVVVRSMATDVIPAARVRGILGRQTGVGILNGLFLATASGLVTVALLSAGIFSSSSTPAMVAGVVAMAALVNLTIATVAGTAIPLTLRRLGLDPALAGTIFLTLITDAVGFGGFLLVATIFL
jgi:magnesium transporter